MPVGVMRSDIAKGVCGPAWSVGAGWLAAGLLDWGAKEQSSEQLLLRMCEAFEKNKVVVARLVLSQVRQLQKSNIHGGLLGQAASSEALSMAMGQGAAMSQNRWNTKAQNTLLVMCFAWVHTHLSLPYHVASSW